MQVGGGAPVVVQSMTNTDTADVASTSKQIAELWRAGSELVRVTVNTAEAAAAVPRIVERLAMMGVHVPIIGDFHYNGHHAAGERAGLCRGAGEVPHQPRQRRLRQEEGHPVRPADRVRHPLRQAGADRRQLGLAGPGAGGAADGRERTARRAVGCRPGDARGADPVGAGFGAARGGAGPAGRAASCSAPRSVRRAGADRGVPRPGPAQRLRPAPRADRGRHRQQGHRGLQRGAWRAAAGRHRRHHPHLADARSRARRARRKWSSRRNCCRPWACARSRRW